MNKYKKSMTTIAVILIVIGGALLIMNKKCVSTFDPVSQQSSGGCYYIWQKGWWGNTKPSSKVVTIQGIASDKVINSFKGRSSFLKVKKDDGSEIRVIYHDGKQQCDGSMLKELLLVGSNIEIHGLQISDDTITLCGSDDYYVRVLYKNDLNSNIGITIHYPDFDLVLLEKIPLSREQEAEKDESISKGINGGSSMMQPSQRFKILAKDGTLIMDSSIEMLPYARDEFSVNGKSFIIFGNMEIEDANGNEYKELNNN